MHQSGAKCADKPRNRQLKVASDRAAVGVSITQARPGAAVNPEACYGVGPDWVDGG
jgi:hypothetical protein